MCLGGMKNANLASVQHQRGPVPHRGNRRCGRHRAARLIEGRRENRTVADTGKVAILLLAGGQLHQRNHAKSERGQRRSEGAVLAKHPERYRHLGQAQTITAQPFRQSQTQDAIGG
ncbi:Uncharacterised protein [Mycobacteroides abscessus subsp. abscessus]|nr:Uncharacterised protein [Mycobacteroides abscessus subsp. abscessus]